MAEREDEPTTVVGIDGSEASMAALRWAARHVRDAGVVEAVAVWHQPVQFGEPIPMPPEEFEAEARAWLAAAQRELSTTEPGAEVRTRLEQGEPATVLLGYAQDADLLVLGNHGRGAIVGALLGSVAQRCAHKAPCPVVLVPSPATAGPVEGSA